MMTFSDLDTFRAHIETAYGLELLGELRADGHFHGLATDQDRHGAKPFRYSVHLDEPQNIYFQDLKRGFAGTCFPQGQAPLDPVERERLRRAFEAKRAERDSQIADQHAKTARRAQAL